MPLGEYSELDKCHWVKYINSSGETIPPYGVLRVTGTTSRNGEPFFTVAKPTAAKQKFYPINGAASVAAGAVGECTFSQQAIAALGSAPSFGTELGPVNNSWTLSTSGTGFYYYGSKSNNRSLLLGEVVQVASPTSTATTEVKWGLCQANWVNNDPYCDYVVVKQCDDCDGNNPVDPTIEVLLPPANESDPNVVAGYVIAFAQTTDSSNVCVSDYMDDKIGTVKMWSGVNIDVPVGWGVMDGSDNSSGSGINLKDKFVRGTVAQSGGSGGENTHRHVITVIIADHVEYELTHSHTILGNITVDDHTVEELLHAHDIEDTPGDLYVQGSSGDPQLPTFRSCTGDPIGPYDYQDGLGPRIDWTDCAQVTWGPIGHRVAWYLSTSNKTLEFPSQKHYPETACSDAENIPEYVEMIFIERLDNSS
jgi:hypothetical protein